MRGVSIRRDRSRRVGWSGRWRGWASAALVCPVAMEGAASLRSHAPPLQDACLAARVARPRQLSRVDDVAAGVATDWVVIGEVAGLAALAGSLLADQNACRQQGYRAGQQRPNRSTDFSLHDPPFCARSPSLDPSLPAYPARITPRDPRLIPGARKASGGQRRTQDASLPFQVAARKLHSPPRSVPRLSGPSGLQFRRPVMKPKLRPPLRLRHGMHPCNLAS